MIKTLRPIGNSLGLIIERPILELLEIDRETPLRVSTDGKILYIEPVVQETPEGSAVRSEQEPATSRRVSVSGRSGGKRSR
jgi:antitoxin component of MazEF toxin-antitoxin module